jgi:hypothetical protein
MALTRAQVRRHRTAANLASLTIANAFIFQAELAEKDHRVIKLRKLLAKHDLRGAVIEHWKYICDKINYVPIFNLAREAMEELPERSEVQEALRQLGNHVLKIVEQRAALRHDLMGRIYHRLLLEAKYLGTFYTSVPAATLLLKIALAPEEWDTNWADFATIENFRTADLACGTGTLLMAAQQTIADNYIRASTREGKPVSADALNSLHKIMMQAVLNGYDVLSSAVHLTASTLALLAPGIEFKKMNLHCVPLGEYANGEIRLGSVDYLQSSSLQTQLDLMGSGGAEAQTVTGAGFIGTTAPLPELDLCVMNPPFTRSVGGNLLFGSLPNNQRKKMQTRLRNMLAGTAVLANSTAGLGSVFVAVASPHIKAGGCLALVIPAALAFGVAWQKTRQLLSRDYVVKVIIASHDPERWNFSENTSLSELLVVARKRGGGLSDEDERTVCVNLWSNTTTPVDALSLADAIPRGTPAQLDGVGMGICPITTGGVKRGETVSIPSGLIKDSQWYPVAFAQTELLRVAHHLRSGVLYRPSKGPAGKIPLVQLGSLGKLGPDRRDIYDGFTLVDSKTAYPAFWSHNAENVFTLQQEPNKYLNPRTKAMKGRNLRRVDLLWPRAGRMMVAERMRLNTQRLTTIRLPTAALSNVWWPLALHTEDLEDEKVLALWLNSTLGLILFCMYRVPTEGPWVQFKKPSLGVVPILNPAGLKVSQKKILVDAYDQLSEATVQPLTEMHSDKTRIAFDTAIQKALGLPDLDDIRRMLAAEPIISGKRLS